MPRIEPVSAREIEEELNLSAAALGRDEEGMRSLINRAKTDVERVVNRKVDQWATPYDFPFSAATIKSAYPSKSEAERQEIAEDQMGAVRLWLKFSVVAQLLGRANFNARPGMGSPYADRIEAARSMRDENKELAEELIRFVAGQTTEGQTAQTKESGIPVSTSVRVRRTY